MGRILIPIDPRAMGYQRQRADVPIDHTPSVWDQIAPHVLVNTAIPLAGEALNAGIQQGTDAYNRWQFDKKRGAAQATAAAAARAPADLAAMQPAERQPAAPLERSPRAEAAKLALGETPPQGRQIGDPLYGGARYQWNDMLGESNPAQSGDQTSEFAGYRAAQATAAWNADMDKWNAKRQFGIPENLEDHPGYRGDWAAESKGAPLGALSGQPMNGPVLDEEGNPLMMAGRMPIPKVGVPHGRALAAGALAGASVGGATIAPPATPNPAPPPKNPATGVSGVNPLSSPPAMTSPPVVAAPPPADVSGRASATGTPGGATAPLPKASRAGAPAIGTVDESKALGAVQGLEGEPDDLVAPEQDPEVAAQAAAVKAALAPQPDRVLLDPKQLHDYQSIANAAVLAKTPGERQQVLDAAIKSQLEDAPAESWLDVIHPAGRRARAFDAIRNKLGHATKQDELADIKRQNLQSLIDAREAQKILTGARTEGQKYTNISKAAEARWATALAKSKTLMQAGRAHLVQVHAKYAAALEEAGLDQKTALALVAAQDAADRGESNKAKILMEQAMAGRNNAEINKINELLPYWKQELQTRSDMQTRMPAPSTSVSVGVKAAVKTEDDLREAYRKEFAAKTKLEAALKKIKDQKGKTDEEIFNDPDVTAIGGLIKLNPGEKLSRERLLQRLEREALAAAAALKPLQAEIEANGGKVDPQGFAVFGARP